MTWRSVWLMPIHKWFMNHLIKIAFLSCSWIVSVAPLKIEELIHTTWTNCNDTRYGNKDLKKVFKDRIFTSKLHFFYGYFFIFRNCIGQHFAMNEEKTIISRILERYILTLCPQKWYCDLKGLTNSLLGLAELFSNYFL